MSATERLWGANPTLNGSSQNWGPGVLGMQVNMVLYEHLGRWSVVRMIRYHVLPQQLRRLHRDMVDDDEGETYIGSPANRVSDPYPSFGARLR